MRSERRYFPTEARNKNSLFFRALNDAVCCVCLNLHHHHRVPPSDNNFLFLLRSLFYLFATRRFSSDFAFHIIGEQTAGGSTSSQFVLLLLFFVVGARWDGARETQSSDSALWDWDERNIKKCKMKKKNLLNDSQRQHMMMIIYFDVTIRWLHKMFFLFFFSFSSLLAFLGLPTIDVDDHSFAPRLDRDRESERYVKSKESGSSQRRRGEWKWRRNGEQKL